MKYEDYKNQTVEDIFTKEQLEKAVRLDAYNMQSSVMINKGNGSFTVKALPVEAQLSCMYAIVVDDFDGDGREDIMMGGNFYQSKPEVGIYDGSYGCVLKGDGRGNFRALSPRQSGVMIKGAVRDMMIINTKKNKLLLAAENNDKIKLMKLK